jgi:hypothetical protein
VCFCFEKCQPVLLAGLPRLNDESHLNGYGNDIRVDLVCKETLQAGLPILIKQA